MGRSDESQEDRTVVRDIALPPAVAPRQKKVSTLEQIAGTGAPRKFSLELSEIVIGRSLQATISIEGNGISRHHAAVRKNGADFSVTDLGSANGLYLNGIKTHSAVLHDGDQIQLGDAVFVFHEGA